MKFLAALFFGLTLSAAEPARQVERWGVFELAFTGPSTGNPFLDVRLGAQFRYRNRVVDVEGFRWRRRLQNPLHAR